MSWLQDRGLRFKLALGISSTMLISLGLAFFVLSQYIQNQLWQRETQSAENLNAHATDRPMVNNRTRADPKNRGETY